MKHSFTNLNPDEIRRKAESPENIVMQETYSIHFDPWPLDRVKKCVLWLQSIARNASSKEEVEKKALKEEELKSFSEHYLIMFARLCEPEVSKNDDLVAVLMAMIALKQRVNDGELTESEGKAQASSTALESILRQTSNIEELD